MNSQKSFLNANSQKLMWVSIKTPFSFFILMLAVLASIITSWLLACSFLLEIPLLPSKPLDSLGFVLGYVWAYFASSWALLALLQPDLSHFAGFSRVLGQHLEHAPGLYSLHLLCFIALICWSICLFNGLIARTDARARKFIKITAILFVLLLLFSLIFLLFSDVFLTHCVSSDKSTSWFSSWFSPETLKPTSSQQVITNSLNILHEAANTSTITCQNLADEAFNSAERGSPRAAELKNKAMFCRDHSKLWIEATKRVTLEYAKSDGGQPANTLSGFEQAVQAITLEVVKPAAQLVVDSALQGAVKEVGKDLINTSVPFVK